jgi:hypothetical protein
MLVLPTYLHSQLIYEISVNIAGVFYGVSARDRVTWG